MAPDNLEHLLDRRAIHQVERRLRGMGMPPRTPAEMVEWLRRLGDLAPEELEGRSLAPLLGEGWRARLLRRRLADRDLHAEEHYYWWRNGRRASARDIRATPIAVALWRGDWWYVRSLAGEQVRRWPPLAGEGDDGAEPANARAADAPSEPALSELRREARALARTRVVSTDPRPEDRELDEQLRSLGYGGGP